MGGLNVTFYVGSNIAIDAIVRNFDGPLVAQSMPQLVWFQLNKLIVDPWFARVDSDRNIGHLPTRLDKFPLAAHSAHQSRPLGKLLTQITNATEALKNGKPAQPLE